MSSLTKFELNRIAGLSENLKITVNRLTNQGPVNSISEEHDQKFS